MIDLAEREGVEHRQPRRPIAPADRGYTQGERLHRADRSERLDPVRLPHADPADDQRNRCPGGPQGPQLRRQPGRMVTGHDPIVRAITPGQLELQPLPGGAITPHDHDGDTVSPPARPGVRANSRFHPIPGGALS
jgi:hypothetical protein